jgi:hypothetical protein
VERWIIVESCIKKNTNIIRKQEVEIMNENA